MTYYPRKGVILETMGSIIRKELRTHSSIVKSDGVIQGRGKHYKSGGVHGLRDSLAGLLEVRLNTCLGGKILNGTMKHFTKLKREILCLSLNVNQLGAREHAPREVLKLSSCEIAGNVYFSIYFCTFKVF